jgi:hypothetical protein
MPHQEICGVVSGPARRGARLMALKALGPHVTVGARLRGRRGRSGVTLDPVSFVRLRCGIERQRSHIRLERLNRFQIGGGGMTLTAEVARVTGRATGCHTALHRGKSAVAALLREVRFIM